MTTSAANGRGRNGAIGFSKRGYRRACAALAALAVVVTGPGAITASAQEGDDEPAAGSTATGPQAPYVGGVYDKPWTRDPESAFRLGGDRVTIGGYVDIEYFDRDRTQTGVNGDRQFQAHRLVPMINAKISDRISFASEIEIEYGGITASGVGGSTTGEADGDVKVEFAMIDMRLSESDLLNLRGGIILMPIGLTNPIHDAPIQDFTQRPLADRFVVPSTFFQAGFGVFGTAPIGEEAKLKYELYATNGLRGFDVNANGYPTTVRFSNTNGTRNGRYRGNRDSNNNNASLSGRLEFSPFLGLHVAYGGFFGQHSPTNFRGEKLGIDIHAVDAAFRRGPWEIMGGYNRANIDVGTDTRLVGTMPNRLDGYTIQLGYHFLPEWMKSIPGGFITDQSTFTLVGRYEGLDLTEGVTGAASRGEYNVTRVGLNFRPVEETVIKTEYSWQKGDHPLDTFNEFALSFATYF
jgi:hypothetical protein